MTTATVATTSTWEIDNAHSSAEFSVRHLMIATVKGRFSGLSGTVSLDPDDIAAARAEVRIDAATIDTHNADRDKHLRSADFFDVERYPEIRFASRSVEAAAGDGFAVHGDLTMHGVTRPVTLAVQLEGRARDPWGNDRLAFSGSARLSRKEFGLEWNQLLETGGVAVSDEVRITLDVELVKQG